MVCDGNKTKEQLLEEIEIQSKRVEALKLSILHLQENEMRYSEILDSLQEVVFEIDNAGYLVYSNKWAFTFFGYTKENAIGLNVLDFIIPQDREKIRDNMIRSIQGQPVGINEYTAQRMDGSQFPIMIHAIPIVQDGQTIGFRGVIMDISEKKKSDERIQYLSVHDVLTELYNRSYFEYEIHRHNKKLSEIGILICDLDGLKFINDTMGYDKGDQLLKIAADIIKESVNNEDIVARIGGDEFAVIVYNGNEQILSLFYKQIQNNIKAYNKMHLELPLSMSIGFAASNEASRKLENILKQADKQMYREKLHRRHSKRNDVVQTLMKALEARDLVTKDHVSRLSDMIVNLAVAAGLSKFNCGDLMLLAQFHDIGKLGVADRILFKPGALTYEERLEIELHCEIGHRIVMASPDLAPIADWVLEHHEWWNGNGYPLGLKGEKIPIECRILSIVDAFDAMINDRPYRKAMTQEDAVAELKRCAGTQFDPRLVDIFIRNLKERENAVFSCETSDERLEEYA